MKTLFLTLVTLTTIISSAFSDVQVPAVHEKKVIVLINTATWCPACKANGQRVEEEIVAGFMKNDHYQIVVNDLSDETSKATSNEACKKAGIAKIAEQKKATGMIYFIDAASKKVIGEISVVKATPEIEKAFEDALKAI